MVFLLMNCLCSCNIINFLLIIFTVCVIVVVVMVAVAVNSVWCDIVVCMGSFGILQDLSKIIELSLKNFNNNYQKICQRWFNVMNFLSLSHSRFNIFFLQIINFCMFFDCRHFLFLTAIRRWKIFDSLENEKNTKTMKMLIFYSPLNLLKSYFDEKNKIKFFIIKRVLKKMFERKSV